MTESNGEMIVNNNLLVINDRNYTNSKSAGDEGDGEDRDGERFECDCRLGPNESACYTQFDGKVMSDHRIDYQSCDYWDDECYNLMNERIIAIMSVLINNSPEVENPTARRRKRQKTSVKFMWRGRPVCKQLFLWVHAMKKPKWTYLKKRYLAYGVEPRQHQNKTKPVNSKAINGEERKAIVQFIREYGRQNARNPNAGADRWVLSADHSVKSIYRHFIDNYSDRRISYETFRNVWRSHCPGIRFEAKNDKTSVIEFIKSYAKRYSSAGANPSDPKTLVLSAEHNVKIIYQEFRDRYDSDISYDVFNHTWKTCCPYIKFENRSHYNKRKCSHCGVDGHTNRKIGDHFLCPLRESESGLSGLMKKAVRK